MSKPTDYPDFATEDVVEVKLNSEGVETSYTNKAVVPPEYRLSGILYRQNPFRQFLNQTLNLVGLWVRYLDELYVVGSVYTTILATEDDASVSARLGGDWEEFHSQVLGAETVKYFKKVN